MIGRGVLERRTFLSVRREKNSNKGIEHLEFQKNEECKLNERNLHDRQPCISNTLTGLDSEMSTGMELYEGKDSPLFIFYFSLLLITPFDTLSGTAWGDKIDSNK